MKRARRSIAVVSAMLLLTGAWRAHAAADKKAHTFHGKVEAVNRSATSLRVQGEKVAGWMDARTLNEKVDDPSLHDKRKPGDQIVATAHDGDSSLHTVHIMRKTAGDSTSKK